MCFIAQGPCPFLLVCYSVWASNRISCHFSCYHICMFELLLFWDLCPQFLHKPQTEVMAANAKLPKTKKTRVYTGHIFLYLKGHLHRTHAKRNIRFKMAAVALQNLRCRVFSPVMYRAMSSGMPGSGSGKVLATAILYFYILGHLLSL